MALTRRHRALAVPLMAVGALVVSSLTVAAGSASGASGGSAGLTAKGALTPASRVQGAKSTTGRLAQSDRALLKRTDSGLVNVVVKLDYDATASYAGNLRGLAATSPRVTGRQLTGRSAAETAYEAYTKGIDAKFRADVARKITRAALGRSLTRVYGGVAMRLPANQVKTLLTLANVAAVQADSLNQPQTANEGPQFIGAPALWSKEGGQANAGQGVIFADLDSGIWPEHPMLGDYGNLSAPPPTSGGSPRACDFGDNPLTPASDVFACNNKVIGGQPFLNTYNAIVGGEVYPDSARDSNGHGTHTTTTAAGESVASAPILGIDRGPATGVAPGAWVMEYKVCGVKGCFGSDSAAAVQQAVIDGADVINFSISGGSDPFSDPVELAFLDAYAAGVTVAASAGNAGPGAATTDHHSPWVITVAASTQTREFRSTLTVTSGADTATFVGSSLTNGVASPLPVVLASTAPYSDIFCGHPAPAGLFTGKIVACQRGGTNADGPIGRVQKGFNVRMGGAAGMILFNSPLADTETDNHWLPAVHLADGAALLAFLAAHPSTTASFTAGAAASGPGDVMASFSSRGPGGLFLKPDITAPGVQVLAGNTPTPDEISAGPPGQLFQAIAGTSMSAPHIAGSAILLKALHPTWGPGAVKSAMMTTAKGGVVKEDLTTPADPFDDGSGRVDLTKAGNAAVVFEDSGTNMATKGNNALLAPSVNIASVNLPTMSGSAKVLRTARNVSGKAYPFTVQTTAPAGAKITVMPKSGTIAKNGSRTFTITVTSTGTGQQFGEVRLGSAGTPTLHLPVAWFNQQGIVTLSQSCGTETLPVNGTTTCTVTAQNNSLSDAAMTATSEVTNGLRITSADGATVAGNHKNATTGPVHLAGGRDATPSIGAGALFGYIPLDAFGTTPNPVGDEDALNFNVPAFVFGGQSYNRIGATSDGYLVLGGGNGAQDIQFEPQTLPDPARPNGVLAPYWTDLDGDGAPGIMVNVLSDGVNSWLVVEWRLRVFGTTSLRTFQTWIGVDGTEDITYAFDPSALQGAPGQDLTVGVENVTGTGGQQIAGAPTEDLRVTTTPPSAGESFSYTLGLRGVTVGNQSLKTSMQSDLTLGSTVVSTPVRVTAH
ncbi:MAG: S8 family serine peptidase [Actinomycetales bacterium]